MTAQENGKGLMIQGRIVWTMGKSLFEGKQMTDYNTNAPILDETGQPVIEYGFGLAIPKINNGQYTPEYTAIYQAIHAEAATLYPNGAPKDFAYKFKDGDTDVDDKGVPYSKREGYANHFVLACTTRIPIKFFIWQNGNNVVVNTGIKNGDYVNVQLNLKAHPPKGRGKAGIYTNPSAVQLIVPGKEIINTPSGDQLFGQNAPAYNGQVEAHQAPTMPGMGQPAMAPMGMPPVAQPQYAPQQPAYAPAAPQHDPHYQILPAQHQPQYAPPAPNGMPPMGQPQYTSPVPNGMPGIPR